MEKQYCKVGGVTPNTEGRHSVTLLEHLYQNFVDMALTQRDKDSQSSDFFTQKAENIKSFLNSLA